MKFIRIGALVSALFTLTTVSASAHVVVQPKQVGIAQFQSFTMGVPSEKDSPTTVVRLVIPEGVSNVTPTVKPGWNIHIKKEGGDDAHVTELTWTDGSIPVGQRDEFSFSAQVPSTPTTLAWKAYQTYENGNIVAWDQKASTHAHTEGDNEPKPYSETKIIDDLLASASAQAKDPSSTALTFSLVALTFSIIALGIGARRKRA